MSVEDSILFYNAPFTDVSERGSGSGSLRPLTPLTTIPEESSPKQQPQSIVAVDAASPPQSSAPDGHSEPEKGNDR